jgi:hypothetical protein
VRALRRERHTGLLCAHESAGPDEPSRTLRLPPKQRLRARVRSLAELLAVPAGAFAMAYQLGAGALASFLVLVGSALALLWGPIRSLLRVRDLIGRMPAFFVLALGGLVFALFTEEVWRTTTTVDLWPEAVLAPLPVVLFAWVVLRLDRGIPKVFGEMADDLRTSHASNPDGEAIGDALRVLRDLAGTNGLLGSEPGRRFTLRVLRHGGFFRRTTGSPCDPQVRRILADAFRDPRSAGSARWAAESLRRTFRLRVLLGLSVLSVLLTLLTFGLIYLVAALFIDVEVAKTWVYAPGSTREIPTETALSWLGAAWEFPAGPYLWMAGSLALVATTVFFVFIVTDEVRYSKLAETLIHEPIGRCLAAALPYLHLPTNDRFERAHVIGGAHGAIRADNCLERIRGEIDGEPDRGSGTAWYRWQAPADGRVTFTTAGSSFDALLAVYSGQGDALSLVAGSESATHPGDTVTFVAKEASEYRIAVTARGSEAEAGVDGGDGAGAPADGGSFVLAWRTNDAFDAAHAIGGPQGRVHGSTVGATKEEGEPDHAGVEGGASVWYRWTAPADGRATFTTAGSTFDTVLAVYTGSRLDSLSPVASNDDALGYVTSRVAFDARAGEVYSIAVDGFGGASGDVLLGWGFPPPNDGFDSAEPLTGAAGAVRSFTVGATAEPGEPQHGRYPGGASVWYRWTAPVAGVATFSTDGSTFDTILAVYTGSELGSLELLTIDDGGFPFRAGAATRVEFHASAGAVYAIAVDGLGGAGGDLLLSWGGPPENDRFDAATVLTGASGVVQGLTAGAEKEDAEPAHAGHPAAASVWYRWTAPQDGRVTFTTAGSSFNTVLAVYTGSRLRTLLPVPTTERAYRDGTSLVAFDVVDGKAYMIAVDGFKGAVGELVLGWAFSPPNDDFEQAARLSGESGAVRGSSVGASKEADEPDHAGDEGGASVWYRWRAPSDGQTTFTTAGSSFDTLLAVYTGSGLDGLSHVAGNDDAEDIRPQSRVRFEALAKETYRIAVDGFGGASGDVVLEWRRETPANDRFGSAQVLTGSQGEIAGTNVGATKERGEPHHAGDAGGASVWYHWTAPKDGRVTFATQGSTVDTLLAVYTGSKVSALAEVASNDDAYPDRTSRVAFDAGAGTVYAIAVDGFRGDTGEILLTWSLEEPPHNDAFATAQELTGASGRVSGTTLAATKEPGERAHAGEAGGASVWYRWTAPEDARVTFTTAGSSFDTLLAVYAGSTLESLAEIVSDDDAHLDGTSRVAFDAEAGTVYAIAVDGFSGDSGELVLMWGPPPANDDLAGATELAGESSTVTTATFGATKEAGEPDHAGNPGGASVWFRWAAPDDGSATFTTAGSSFDTLLAVYTGSKLASLTRIASDDDGNPDLTSRVTFETKAREVYLVAVDGFAGETGDLVLAWEWFPSSGARKASS